ncbi:MAG TPA: tetratricopeptide repeat protein, partial [Syntrophorhabdaceae bacterium]|nr:tetratricopeptide repeat protein [Syntrophorhabdaceae bacterium]
MMKYIIVILILFFTPITLFGSSNNSSIFFFLKGYRSETQGRLDDAVNYYKSAIEKDPSSAALRTGLAIA